MEVQFLQPGPLIDRELELIAPSAQHADDVLAACRHPLSIGDAGTANMTRERIDELLRLAPNGMQPADRNRHLVPQYHFWMKLHPVDNRPAPVTIAGGLGLRIGRSFDLEMYLGHLGYNVFPPARGNHYAERACRLVLPLARAHGMREIWITCNPDNYASRRTCERLGCAFVDIVPIPHGHMLHRRGEYHKCRYRLDL